MGPRTTPLHRRVVAAVAIGALAFSLPACGNRLAKSELLADNQVGAVVQQSGQATDTTSAVGTIDTGAATGTVPAGSATGTTPATTGATAPGTTGTTGGGTRTTNAGKGPAAASSGTGTPGPTACTGPKSEIAIGTVGGQSGFIGGAVRAGVDAIKAWVADTNAKGGLNCHPIRYYVADDGGDPSKNAALTQQMVEDRKVIAMLFSNNPLSAQGGKPILERARIPTIGSEGADDYFNTSPDFFPLAATGTKLIEANYGMLNEQLTAEQKQHLGVLTCLEAAVCANFGGVNGTRVAEKFGMKVVYSGNSTMVQPDYTSNCQSAKNAGVQAFFTVGDGGFTSRIIRSCAKIGFKPQFASSPVAMAASVVDLPELEGILLGATAEPWVSDHPLVKRYLTTLQKYLPGSLPQGSGSVGWAAAMMFEKVAANLPDNPTSQDVYNGLYRIKNFDFDGYTAPLTYTKGKGASYPTCWWTMTIRGKQWTSPNGSERACVK